MDMFLAEIKASSHWHPGALAVSLDRELEPGRHLFLQSFCSPRQRKAQN
jgi:hypothetical protein